MKEVIAKRAPGDGVSFELGKVLGQNQKFAVASLDAGAFAHWLAETKAQPNRLDAAAILEVLSRRSILPHPLAFGAVDPGIFDRIVRPGPA